MKEDEASGSVTFSKDDAGTARVQTKPIGSQFMGDEPWVAKLRKPTKAPTGEQQPGVLGSLRRASGERRLAKGAQTLAGGQQAVIREAKHEHWHEVLRISDEY